VDFKRKILPILAKSSFIKKVLQRNKKFESLHQGESCYIFGNGASLKYFDLKKFADKIAIGCGGLFLHHNFEMLNIKYYYESHPFFYYPYWINPYSHKLTANILGIFYKQKMSSYKNISFFVNMSNYYGIGGDNVYYLHHFSQPFKSYTECRMDDKFTSMASALAGMLGIALFMGFTDITLVGCDYTFLPKGEGHFYDFGKSPDILDKVPYNKLYLLDAARQADIRVVTPHDGYRGHLLPYITYKDLTGCEPEYKENHEIVSKSNLLTLSKSGMIYYKIQPLAL
jgi:hypothetical protein